jgi:glycosyltransferase involved in cell wall biosynthesis
MIARVLSLVPISRDARKLSRYSFLDEELRALAATGLVDVFVFSEAPAASSDEGGIHVRPLPSDSMSWRVRAARFYASYSGIVPFANLMDPLQVYRGLRAECAAADLVRTERIDIVHSYFGWPKGYGGQLVKAATGTPLVAGLRGADINVLPQHDYGARLDASFDRSVRRLLRVADRTVSVSDFVRRQAIALGARPEAAEVILKGVRLDLFDRARRPAARARLGLGGTPMVLAVAGLVPIKGLGDILRAMSIVSGRGLPFRLMICGEGGERDRLQRQAEAAGLSERVTFAGKVPRDVIADYFAAADVFVHAALIEASGNVLLEAMSAGLPAVCTDAGGPAEYVSHDHTGFVVPVADSPALAERVTWLLQHDAEREKMGIQARALAESRFSYDRMTGETVRLYRSLLEDSFPGVARTH